MDLENIIPSILYPMNSIGFCTSIMTILVHGSSPVLPGYCYYSTRHYTRDHHRAALALPILPAEVEAEDTLPAGSSLAVAAVAATIRLSSAEDEKEEVVVVARATNRIDAAGLAQDREH